MTMYIKRIAALCCLLVFLSSALPVFALEGEGSSSTSVISEEMILPGSSTVTEETAPPVTETPPPAVQEAPQPLVVIRGSQSPSSISADQEAQVTITVENVNGKELISPILTVTPSDSLMILGGSSSFSMENVPEGQIKSVTLKVKGTGTISSPAQSLGVELRFNYDNNVTQVQATVSDRIPISAQVKAPQKATQPAPHITRTPLQAIQPGQEFSLVVTVKNVGDAAMDNTLATVSAPDGLILQNDNSAFSLGSIGPGKSAILTLNLKAKNDLASTMEAVGLDLKYSYSSGEGTVQGSTSEKINLTTTPSTSAPGSVPNIIVDTFNYGKDPVAAGSDFPLSFTLLNTGNLPVENLVVTVDGGDSFTIDGGSNTLYHRRLSASGKQTETIRLQALSTAKTGAQSLAINCRYEYSEGGKRSPATADIRLSIPVIQPDRFQVSPPVIPDTIYAGEELTLSLNYVNKGKGEASNVEAILEGNVDSPAKTQYLGNFESGKSGSIGFVMTPNTPGQLPLTLKINYEDGNQEVHTLTFPLKLEVQEAMDLSFDDMDLPDQEKKPPVFLLIPAGLILAGAGGWFFFLHRKKSLAAAAPQEEADDSWDEWDEFDTPQQDLYERGDEE